MKLTIRKSAWGAVHARGGRVLRVSREHPVTTDSFDARGDDAPTNALSDALGSPLGFAQHKPRAFEEGERWKTAAVGSVAMEVVARKTNKVLGYAYLSGPTIAMHRYVDDQTREFYAACFEPAVGWRISLAPIKDGSKTLENSLAAMMRVKYGEAAVAQLTCACDTLDMAKMLSEVLVKLWKHTPAETHPDFATRNWHQVTHLLALIEIKREKESVTLNFQPPAERSPYAVQLFHHHLVESSPDLVPHVW